jgi:MOSC domain-containing protein YiiM
MKSHILPRIFRLSISPEIGGRKFNVRRVRVIASHGCDGDAHCYTSRPISLLPYESFGKSHHPGLEIKPGDFAENITTLGLAFGRIHVGSRLLLGKTVEIEIIQLGKKCRDECNIKSIVGDCIMPREGLFGRALTTGEVAEGDSIEIRS